MSRIVALLSWSLAAAIIHGPGLDQNDGVFPPRSEPNSLSAGEFLTPGDCEARPRTIAASVCRVIAGVGPGTHYAGSGTNIDSKGLVLTCAHVVGPRTGAKITLQFPSYQTDGRSREIIGEVTAVSSIDDLAVVAFDNSLVGVLAVRIATDTPRINDPLWTIGYPGMHGPVVRYGRCDGYLSGYSSAVPDAPVHWLAVSCWIDHGDSGGGVFTSNGELVGVQANGPGNQCYALNLNTIQAFCKRLPPSRRGPQQNPCPGGQCPTRPGELSPTPTNPEIGPSKPMPSSPPPLATPEISAPDLARLIAEAVRKELEQLQPKAGKDGKDGAPGERGPAGKDADAAAISKLQARIEAIEKALASGGVLRIRVTPSNGHSK